MMIAGILCSLALCLTGWMLLLGASNSLLTRLFHIGVEAPAQNKMKAMGRLAGAELIFASMMLLICSVMQHFAVIMVSGIIILFSAIATAVCATRDSRAK